MVNQSGRAIIAFALIAAAFPSRAADDSKYESIAVGDSTARVIAVFGEPEQISESSILGIHCKHLEYVDSAQIVTVSICLDRVWKKHREPRKSIFGIQLP